MSWAHKTHFMAHVFYCWRLFALLSNIPSIQCWEKMLRMRIWNRQNIKPWKLCVSVLTRRGRYSRAEAIEKTSISIKCVETMQLSSISILIHPWGMNNIELESRKENRWIFFVLDIFFANQIVKVLKFRNTLMWMGIFLWVNVSLIIVRLLKLIKLSNSLLHQHLFIYPKNICESYQKMDKEKNSIFCLIKFHEMRLSM